MAVVAAAAESGMSWPEAFAVVGIALATALMVWAMNR